MKNSKIRIPRDIAPDIFKLAAQSYAQEHQDYSLEELMQAGAEAQIPPELIQQAVQQIRVNQIQARERQKKLKLIFISGTTGAAIALFGVWAYASITHHFVNARRSREHRFPFAHRLWNPEHRDIYEDHFRPWISPNGENQDMFSPDNFRPRMHHGTYNTTVTGEVQQYLLNPEGKVDGLLLKNGLQIKFPPDMGDSVMAIVSPGTQVSIFGTPGVSTRFGQELIARSITNSQTGRIVVEQGPTIPMQMSSVANYSTLSVEGTAQHWLVGHQGDIIGVILSNGAIVNFPPHIGHQLIDIANVGDKVQAKGFGTRNSSGQTLQATTLSINGQAIVLEPSAVVGP
jgi:hypothetical protein